MTLAGARERHDVTESARDRTETAPTRSSPGLEVTVNPASRRLWSAAVLAGLVAVAALGSPARATTWEEACDASGRGVERLARIRDAGLSKAELRQRVFEHVHAAYAERGIDERQRLMRHQVELVDRVYDPLNRGQSPEQLREQRFDECRRAVYRSLR